MPLTGTGRTSGPLMAKDIMVRKLFTVRPEQDVYDAIELLLKKKVSGAPVVDSHYALVGMLSEVDCVHALVSAAYDQSPTMNVGAAMTRDVTTISEDTDLLAVANLFLNNGFRRLPVVRDGTLVGQISRRDLLGALNKLMKKVPEHHAALLYLSALQSSPPGSLSPEDSIHD